jgi:hypothetical protein
VARPAGQARRRRRELEDGVKAEGIPVRPVRILLSPPFIADALRTIGTGLSREAMQAQALAGGDEEIAVVERIGQLGQAFIAAR